MSAAVALKISADLADAARSVAGDADRSLTGQVEHWARLGRVFEALIPTQVALALKRTSGDLNAIEDPVVKGRVLAALHELQSLPPSVLRERMGVDQQVRFEPDPAVKGGMVRISPDGTRVRGSMKGRTFIPAPA